ncbi:MAG: CBS domain-containing protein [Pseudorhodoplanes sp.]|nr:MAG: CBS domain-containing protein [Pseudorhodoplanes sp.]
MKACDVMTLNVITIGPDLDVTAVANTLVGNQISAVPVVAMDGKLLGIVSEGDLMRHTGTDAERRRSWWLDFFRDSSTLARDFARTHARKAKDVMTRNPITVSPDTALSEIATLFEKHGIKRVPVVLGGRLVGIVSRANLIQALASRGSDVFPPRARSDEALREAIVTCLRDQPWAKRPINIVVNQGVVDLWGFVDNAAEKDAIRVAAEATPGVKAVNDNLRVYPAVYGAS